MSVDDSISGRKLKCPGCGEALELPADIVEPIAVCPYCSQQFLTESGAALDASDDERAREEADRRHASELDSLRMRKIAALRRSANKARGYVLIAVVLCLVAAIKLALIAWHDLRLSGFNWRVALDLLLATTAIYGVVYFLRRARAFANEPHTCKPPERADEPDFEALSDGSQRIRDFDDIR